MTESLVLIGAGSAVFARGLVAALIRQGKPAEVLQELDHEQEQALELLSAIREGRELIVSANLPNVGQVPNLPRDAVAESPARVTPRGLRPLPMPPLPAGIVGTLATRLAWVETIVEAALEGSREKFIQALVLDGTVESFDAAARLADALLAARAEHLPQFKRS